MATVRILAAEELDGALRLARRVFDRFEAPEYSPEGVQNFADTLAQPEYRESIHCYGAFDGSTLIGMLATRNAGAHITLFFVEEAYHRQGVGRMLFTAALADARGNAMTVNSSPYAVEVYRRLGFIATRPEQVTNGIRYTPMRYRGIP